jgi:hypothetical protein
MHSLAAGGGHAMVSGVVHHAVMTYKSLPTAFRHVSRFVVEGSSV